MDSATDPRKHAAKGEIERHRLQLLAEAGMTIAEIAEQVGLSKTAVRHWMTRDGLRTKNGRGRRPNGDSRVAEQGAPRVVTLLCAHHGRTEFVREGRGYYRCKQCRMERVARRRRKLKQLLVAEAGGRCCICGYDRHLGALAFHHVDPQEKRLQISWNGITQSLDALRDEARKCVLLCSNCHAAVEGGVVQLAATVSAKARRHPPQEEARHTV
jgi:hypothetical protein